MLANDIFISFVEKVQYASIISGSEILIYGPFVGTSSQSFSKLSKKPNYFPREYNFFLSALTINICWSLTVAFYPKVKDVGIKQKLTKILYFWVPFKKKLFLKGQFTRECSKFPCCTIFHKAKFPNGCVNHVFYTLSYHITFWVWLNLVWYVTILQNVCPREL